MPSELADTLTCSLCGEELKPVPPNATGESHTCPNCFDIVVPDIEKGVSVPQSVPQTAMLPQAQVETTADNADNSDTTSEPSSVAVLDICREHMTYLREQLASKHHWLEVQLEYERQKNKDLQDQLEIVRNRIRMLSIVGAEMLMEVHTHNRTNKSHTTLEAFIDNWQQVLCQKW